MRGSPPPFDPAELGFLHGLREDLHAHPELSGEEEETASRLERALAEFAGVSGVRRVAGTGLIARIPGKRAGAPVVALRGDIDALPIGEETGAPFASTVPGVMHACGHDIHATWVVGAARLLQRDPAEGEVRIVLQPAEEIGTGARALLESGALDGVSAIFGGHVDLRFPVGKVVAQTGPLAAAADEFVVEIEGAGAHGARPHEGRDPVLGAAALVQALQSIVSRRVAPGIPAVLTVGKIHGGTAPNVIPGRVSLEGTLRALDPETRALLHAELRRISRGVAEAHGLSIRVEIREGPPPIVNPPQATAWAREGVERSLGPDALVPLPGINMAGEDFANYLERMPGCFLRIGAGPAAGGEVPPAHSPRFLPDPGSVAVGAAVLAGIARVASSALAAAAPPPAPALEPASAPPSGRAAPRGAPPESP